VRIRKELNAFSDVLTSASVLRLGIFALALSSTKANEEKKDSGLAFIASDIVPLVFSVETESFQFIVTPTGIENERLISKRFLILVFKCRNSMRFCRE
jgi:hypothetical protein